MSSKRLYVSGAGCRREIKVVPFIMWTCCLSIFTIWIQLAVNAQIPIEYGGLGGKAIYIEGSFMVERVLQMADACAEDMLEYNNLLRNKSQACDVDKQLNSFLDNILYFRICTYTEQMAVVNYMEKFISEHKDVKVVIINSITFHFRQDFEDMALRTRLLSGIALKLMKLAKKFNLAIHKTSSLDRLGPLRPLLIIRPKTPSY